MAVPQKRVSGKEFQAVVVNGVRRRRTREAHHGHGRQTYQKGRDSYTSRFQEDRGP
jgi:hypothetical protein